MNHNTARCVPPSPDLMSRLHGRFRQLLAERRLPAGTTFETFFSMWAARRRGRCVPGIDDGVRSPNVDANAPQLIDRPPVKLKGAIRTLVLLVDFEDYPAPADLEAGYYELLFFGSREEYPTGSLSDFYATASGGLITVVGEVHGWYRMPQKLEYYANSTSGTGESFPRNAQGLAIDAVEVALGAGVDFTSFDSLGDGTITALCIVHSGRGAENTGSKADIWSHKWTIPQPPEVASNPKIVVDSYLTVPHDCRMGVCAHEWGHLAARWPDLYDTGPENTQSNGLGHYCLMASGTWADGGLRPTLPCGMLRAFHDWVGIKKISATTKGIVLKPAAENGDVVVLKTNKMSASQYVLIEYRKRTGQDRALPDEGVAVYVIDESIDNVNDENHLAIELVQADGFRDLASISMGNPGDSEDLYPSQGKRVIGKSTTPRLALPGGAWAGATIRVKGDPGDPTMSIDIEVP